MDAPRRKLCPESLRGTVRLHNAVLLWLPNVGGEGCWSDGIVWSLNSYCTGCSHSTGNVAHQGMTQNERSRGRAMQCNAMRYDTMRCVALSTSGTPGRHHKIGTTRYKAETFARPSLQDRARRFDIQQDRNLATDSGNHSSLWRKVSCAARRYMRHATSTF